jgi:hypothetical protein
MTPAATMQPGKRPLLLLAWAAWSCEQPYLNVCTYNMGTGANYFFKQHPLPCHTNYLLDLPPPSPDARCSSEPSLPRRCSSSKSTACEHAKPWLCDKRTSRLYPATCLSELRFGGEEGWWHFRSVGHGSGRQKLVLGLRLLIAGIRRLSTSFS